MLVELKWHFIIAELRQREIKDKISKLTSNFTGLKLWIPNMKPYRECRNK